MAKALTVILLLAATAAFAAAHPGLGKGGFGNIQISGDANATADASKQITISKDGGQDLSKCDCKDDCKTETRKVCKEEPKETEVCKDEEVSEEVVVCENKCFKADKVITIGHGGKGRRLLSANSLNTVPHMGFGKGAGISGNKTEESGAKQQEICREICKPQTKKSTEKKCKKETSVELVDCKDEVVSKRCVKNCACGEKTITISKTPDFGAIIGHFGKGK